MTTPSLDQYIRLALDLFKRDRHVATRLVERANADVCKMAVVEDNVTDVEERQALLHEFLSLCHKHSMSLMTVAGVSLFVLAPIEQLRAQVASAKESGFKFAALFGTLEASNVVRSFLAKTKTGGTPTSSMPNTPKARPAAALVADSTPLTLAGVPTSPGPAASGSKRKASSPAPTTPPSAKKQGKQPAPSTPPAGPAFSRLSGVASPTQGSPNTTRKAAAKRAAYRRDRNLCILSKYGYPDGAHIFPFSRRKDRGDTFQMLYMFWGDKSYEWEIQCQDTGIIESPKNIVCLAKHMHALWGEARFGLKPLRDPRAAEKNQVWVQFHWLRLGSQRPDSPVSINNADNFKAVDEVFNQMVASADTNHGFAKADSDSGGNRRGRNGTLAHRHSGLEIETGQIFVIEAEDPEDLPSLDLLELQWHLVRLAAMSGAANVYLEPGDDDDSVVGAAASATVLRADSDIEPLSLDEEPAENDDDDDIDYYEGEDANAF